MLKELLQLLLPDTSYIALAATEVQRDRQFINIAHNDRRPQEVVPRTSKTK